MALLGLVATDPSDVATAAADQAAEQAAAGGAPDAP
jgi:hypothetical protein